MNKNKNIPEIIIFIIFCIGTTIISFFHEPWHDEFQAWAIAKDNLYNIIFVIPHMEGHPPLWHLIIKFFQQFTDNPELVIKIPNLLAMFAAVWLLLFKSPFPRKIKLALPFTYFIFYQYSIISRPYSLLVLGLFIAAYFYKDKDEHPFKFVSALIFLSMTCAYGMVLAAGITIVWLMEISDKQECLSFLKSYVKDKRFFAMLCLFFVSLLLAAEIYPNNDVTATSTFQYSPFWQKALYLFIGSFADALCYNFISYANINTVNLFSFSFIYCCLWGILCLFLLIKTFKRANELPIFLVPVFLFLTLCGIYIWSHHIGILTITIIFSFWCLFSIKTIQLKQKEEKILKTFLTCILFIQIYWTTIACINEIQYEYAVSRAAQKTIKAYNLDKYKLFANWHYNPIYFNNDKLISPIASPSNENVTAFIVIENTHIQGLPVIINPYFGKNIFYNYNIDTPQVLYNIHKQKNEKEIQAEKNAWKKRGIPDIIIGTPQIETVFGEDFKLYGNYITIKQFDTGYIWKDQRYTHAIPIWVHKDLYDKLKDIK